MSLRGLISFAVGGTLLLFVLYLVISSAQSAYFEFGTLMNGMALGFLAFILLGLGLSLMTESAIASKK